MGEELTADEIREVIRAARIFCPGFSERQYQDLMTLEKRLAHSGYFEAINALVRLEEEQGIPCTQALDVYQQLLRGKEQLEGEISDLKQRLSAQHNANREAGQGFRQLNEDIEQARQGLQAVCAEHKREERELLAFRKKAEKERRQIDGDIEQCREKAKVTEQDIVTAAQLKAEVESRDFSLELILDLCQEFAGHENAREELSRGLTEQQTLSDHIANLKEQGEAREKALKQDLDRLRSEKDKRQAEINNLEQTRQWLEGILAQLQADRAEQDELRRFYRRYQSVSAFMEFLASWRGIFFVRCKNPLFAVTSSLDRSTAGARFWTEKPPVRRCPCCNYPDAAYDESVYQALNLPPGTPLKLQLGE